MKIELSDCKIINISCNDGPDCIELDHPIHGMIMSETPCTIYLKNKIYLPIFTLEKLDKNILYKKCKLILEIEEE